MVTKGYYEVLRRRMTAYAEMRRGTQGYARGTPGAINLAKTFQNNFLFTLKLGKKFKNKK